MIRKPKKKGATTVNETLRRKKTNPNQTTL